MSSSLKKTVIFLVGPTGVGKSEIAFILATKIGGEIVSCDSMQVYKCLNIGTDKPPLLWQRRIPHHLINIRKPEENFTAADYRKLSIDKIDDILRRDKIPIITGGSGLYFRGLIRGIFPGKGADYALREKLQSEAIEKGSAYLYARLKELDPLAAEKIHPNNTRRIIRALEVYHQEGKAISAIQREKKGLALNYNAKIIGLNRDRKLLYRRIDERVEKMFAEGLVKETEELYKNNRLGLTAMQALGYKEAVGYLKGEYDLSEAKRLIARNTRRFAKRQMTWFRKEPDIKWIEISEGELVDDTVKRILETLKWNEPY
ncbi:MAG: tRNA (adenosine(37)-N6)-dimethylallyltransferase MiaA [Candidatus Omnitrophica bacterium]|nr:tRNA (adenosine(37)-N6)-dimethylallyltransferase MiaA [Candidatus Omnitrophota bacterium]